jgi:hypothetical protein
MAKAKFKITPFTNPSGERVFRLSGTLNGKGGGAAGVGYSKPDKRKASSAEAALLISHDRSAPSFVRLYLDGSRRPIGTAPLALRNSIVPALRTKNASSS